MIFLLVVVGSWFLATGASLVIIWTTDLPALETTSTAFLIGAVYGILLTSDLKRWRRP